jgi:hypothetical protein
VRCHVGAKRRAGRARLTRPVLGCYTLATDVACFPEARALCKVERKPLSYVFHSYTQKLIVAAAPVMQLVKHHFPVSSLAVFSVLIFHFFLACQSELRARERVRPPSSRRRPSLTARDADWRGAAT